MCKNKKKNKQEPEQKQLTLTFEIKLSGFLDIITPKHILPRSCRTRNFQKFSSGDGNESLQPFSPSLTGFDIPASVAENVTSESIVKTPNENRPGHVPLRNVADLVYSDKFKNKIKHSRKSNIFTLATNET